jgi:hypothetical protein
VSAGARPRRSRSFKQRSGIRASARDNSRSARTTDRRSLRGDSACAPRARPALSGLGIAHRRGDYGDRAPSVIELWFRDLKRRCVWRNEFETLDQARGVIAAYSLRGEGSTGLLATPDPIDRQRAKIRF